jgi:hypothetical protein
MSYQPIEDLPQASSQRPGFVSRLQLARVSSAILIGLAAAAVALSSGTRPGGDFVARAVDTARDVLSGVDIYTRSYTSVDVPYPLPVIALGLPFTPLNNGAAGALFIGLSSSLLAYALTRDRQYWRLILFLSYPYIESVKTIQFAPLYCVMMIYPGLLAWPLALIKPQGGLVGVVMDKPKRGSVVVSGLLLLGSLLIDPLWPIEWGRLIGLYRSAIIPLLAPFGFVLLAVLIRWRKREWRALLALAALPKRASYDHLLAWMLCRNWREMTILTALSWLLLLLGYPGGFEIMVVYYIALMIMMFYRERTSPAPRAHAR